MNRGVSGACGLTQNQFFSHFSACSDLKKCNNTKVNPERVSVTNNATSETVATLQSHCVGNSNVQREEYPCFSTGSCVSLSSVCDGAPNCDDFSDEGPRGCLLLLIKPFRAA